MGIMFLSGGRVTNVEREKTRINCQWCWTGIGVTGLKLWFSVHIDRNKNRRICKCMFAYMLYIFTCICTYHTHDM